MNKDVLRDYLDRLIDAMQQQDGFDASLAREIEKQVRHDWAGERVLICKKKYDSQAASADLRAGKSIDEVRQVHGISRSQVYNLLKNRR